MGPCLSTIGLRKGGLYFQRQGLIITLRWRTRGSPAARMKPPPRRGSGGATNLAAGHEGPMGRRAPQRAFFLRRLFSAPTGPIKGDHAHLRLRPRRGEPRLRALAFLRVRTDVQGSPLDRLPLVRAAGGEAIVGRGRQDKALRLRAARQGLHQARARGRRHLREPDQARRRGQVRRSAPPRDAASAGKDD